MNSVDRIQSRMWIRMALFSVAHTQKKLKYDWPFPLASVSCRTEGQCRWLNTPEIKKLGKLSWEWLCT